MRFESSVTAISWIPRKRSRACPRSRSSSGIGHYRAAPDRLTEATSSVSATPTASEANLLKGWAEVDDGRIVDAGYEGGGLVGSTTFRLGAEGPSPGIPSRPCSRSRDPRRRGPSSRQSAGVRASHSRGVSRGSVLPGQLGDGLDDAGADDPRGWLLRPRTRRGQPLPRHWVYDKEGNLSHKAGTVDFKTWYREAHGEHTLGATRTPSRSSPRRRAPSSASSRVGSSRRRSFRGGS